MTTGSHYLRTPFHSLSLIAWLLAAIVPSLLTSNPVYLGICLTLVCWTHHHVARRSPTSAAWGSFARFALFFVLFTLLFNMLMGGAGDTVLVELPAWRVNNDQGARLFQLGGAVTLESLILGIVRAMALLSVIYALATFNTLADHSQLLRGLPRWLDQAAVIVSIAIAFMPQLVVAQQDIRQALALRGHRLRKLRDFLPLMLILLGEALERAINLAESMEARGFSGPPIPTAERRRPRHIIATGLLLLTTATVSRDLNIQPDILSRATHPWALWLRDSWPLMIGALGLGMIVMAVRQISYRSHRTRYRRELWRPRDTALSTLSLLAGGFLVALYLYDRAPFVYLIFPKVSLPIAEMEILLPMLAILGPLVFLPSAPSVTATAPRNED